MKGEPQAVLISSQKQLEEAIKNGETHLEIDGRDQFRIGGSFCGQIRVLDIGHLCFQIDENAAPEFNLVGWSVAIFDVRGAARPLIQTTDNSFAALEARGRSTPRLELYGASHARLDCMEDSSPRAEASATTYLSSRVRGDSAFARIDARERATVRHQGRGEIRAGLGVPIICDGRANVFGGVRIVLPPVGIELT